MEQKVIRDSYKNAELSRTIVDVVHIRVRIVRVVYYQRTSQTVAILSRKMAVVPEGSFNQVSQAV